MQFTIRNKDYKHGWVDDRSSFFIPSCMSHSPETARDLPRKRATRVHLHHPRLSSWHGIFMVVTLLSFARLDSFRLQLVHIMRAYKWHVSGKHLQTNGIKKKRALPRMVPKKHIPPPHHGYH